MTRQLTKIRPRSARRGFAIPMVILVMFILVGALAAGFGMLSGELAADDATIQGQSAAAIAEAGLQQGLRNRTGMGLSLIPPAGTETHHLTLAGGYVDISTTQLRPAVGTTIPALFVVVARGVNERTGSRLGGDAVQIASAFATFQKMSMTVQSAMTGINGINKNGGSGEISGVDQCPLANGGSGETLPAVAVPADPGYSGKTDALTGNPLIEHIGATKEDAAAAVPFDWDAIVNDNAITADFDLPASGAGFPSTSWFNADSSRWPIIIVRNGPSPNTNFSLPSDGRGMLIVFGDFTVSGGANGWNGILLIGGRLTSNGSNEVQGATITGLNTKLGFEVADNSVNELNGTKKFLYNSCDVKRALTTMGSLHVYQNTWANSYPTYGTP